MPRRHQQNVTHSGPGQAMRSLAAARRVLRPVAARWVLRSAAACVAVALLAAACGTGGGQDQRHADSRSGQHGPGHRQSARPGELAAASPAGLGLRVMPAPYQLPGGIAGAVGIARGAVLMIAGGSSLAQPATRVVTGLDPVTGRTWPAGRLAIPVHNAAGAMLTGRPVIFGGTTRPDLPAVQAVPATQDVSISQAAPSVQGVSAVQGGSALQGVADRAAALGALPSARSGLAAVTVAGTAYLLGGCNGGSFAADVLATRDGRTFRTVTRLPVPVCQAATAAVGNRVWLFGGRTTAGTTDVIQQVDLASGTARVAGHLPYRLAGAAGFALHGMIYVAGGSTAPATAPSWARPASAAPASDAVLRYEPGNGHLRVAARLPVPVAGAAAAVIGDTAYLIGGADRTGPVPTVVTVRVAASASPAAQPWLAPARGRGHLAPGSQPGALPADVLIADHLNDRLVVIDPHGRLRWAFPRPGDLRPGQTFRVPDDAFFSPGGRYIIATQEDDQVISMIDIASHKIVYRYGAPGRPGMGPDRVDNPDDAMLLPGGDLIAADIKNCRVLIIRPPAHRPLKIIGHSSNVCFHQPPGRFGSPNGAFPMTNGHYLVTEINGDWTSELNVAGHIYWSANPRGVAYPSDSNEIYPGRYLTADYSSAGQVVEFGATGRTRWRMGGLNHPSLALPLPNGNILVNDDFNDRVIVINPATHRIVWQYGHTGVAAARPGYLNDPDGVDLVPPDSLLITHAGTIGQP